MPTEKFLPEHEEFVFRMSQIVYEAVLIRKNYESVSDEQLHFLAATISTDLVNLIFGWDGTPTISGTEIEPLRLRTQH